MPRLTVHPKYVDAFDITFGKIGPTNIILTHYAWWKHMSALLTKKQKPKFDGLMSYFWWTFGKNATEGNSSTPP
jgi:hypothetical protein